MTALELMVTSDQRGLTTVGEIHRSPLDPKAPPVVTDVIARETRSSRFALDPGEYSYYFHVDLGEGKFRVAVTLADNDQVVDAGDFDTRFGFNGRVLHFTVTP